jgi:hypothetical protein
MLMAIPFSLSSWVNSWLVNGSRLEVALGSRPGSHGVGNTPSVLYVRYVPRLFFYQDDDAPAPAPFGGLFADDCVDALRTTALKVIW